MPYTYTHPRPALTVDCVIFGYDHRLDEADLKILFIERDIEPFRGKWALPGGFVRMEETLEAAAKRELREETGLSNVYLEQLYTFGTLDRDPRGRVISVSYFALVNLVSEELQAGTDALSAQWFSFKEMPALAFDHKNIIEIALERLRGKVRYQPIGFELLPDQFTLTELQTLYETVLETSLDKRNFRKKIESYELLRDTGETQRGKAHRAARLYTFDHKRYKQLEKYGFLFEI
ncbi:MAG: NUDIX hydrolase [Candidatus Kapaibacterium sp.]|nr:MAG: NUDIX hydrolase [Candidatus Kapabacteria bacterium]